MNFKVDLWEMRAMNTTLINVFVFLLVVPFFVSAQMPSMGSVSIDELRMTSYAKDSTAGAVILSDYGELDCSGHSCNYTCYQKIKIFKKEFFDMASESIRIPSEDYLSKLEGACYVWENNKQKMYPLTEELIHKVGEGKENYVKFSIPNVKEGAVIEFSYTLSSQYVRLPRWFFQGRVPVKRSELILKTIPVDFGYQLQSFYPWDINERDVEKGNYRWAIKDLPAFEKEEFVINPRDYIATIDFFPNPPETIEQGWKDMVKGLKNKESFMRPDVDFLLPQLEAIKQKSTDSLSLLAACYDFVKENVKWKEKEDNINCRPLKKVFALKSGNAAEINLMLCYMLKELGFSAEPIILSTREGGRISKTSYPSKYNFNYLVTSTKVKGVPYYLDATNDLRPYTFPSASILDCEGVVMQRKELTWVKIEPNASFYDSWVLDLQLDSIGVMKGTAVLTKKGYSALETRKQISETGLDTYKRQLRKQFSVTELSNIRIENIEDITKSLQVYFNLQFEDTTASEKILLNPILVGVYEHNPFKLKERSFPIDFTYPIEHTFRINIKYPRTYKVQSSPDDIAYKTQDNAMFYKYIKSSLKENVLTVYDKFVSKNCYYGADKYSSMKTVIDKMIEKQRESIILIKNEEK